MSDEYNLARSDGEGVAAPLLALQQQQQAALYNNLEKVADSLDRAEPAKLTSDEALGRSIKDTLEKRRAERKEKTGALYQAAEETGDMDTMISIGALDEAFGRLEQKRFNRTEPAKMQLLQTLADDIGVSGGRPARIRDVEEFRQQINSALNDVTNPNHNTMAKILKGSVDEALDTVPDSAEAYKRARASYSRDKSAFDGNALVTQITGRKGKTESPAVADENVYRKILTSPIEDVRRLAKEAAKTEGGVNMIHNIGARLMDDIVRSATKESGEFNSAAFKKMLDKLDQSGRLDAIYGGQRAEELRKIANVGTMINTMPFGNTANYAQSGNTILKKITDVVGRGPVLGPLVRAGGNKYNDLAMQYDAEKRVKKALDLEGLLSYE